MHIFRVIQLENYLIKLGALLFVRIIHFLREAL